MRYNRFEDLPVWNSAIELAVRVYDLTDRIQFRRRRTLRDQLERAAVSVSNNIAEGFERGGRGEFHQFLSTAKASCAELRSQLYVAFGVGYIEGQEFHVLLQHAEEVARIIGGLRVSVAKQRKSS